MIRDKNKHPIDGILLGLHGAMDLDFSEDGEGKLLGRVRILICATPAAMPAIFYTGQ